MQHLNNNTDELFRKAADCYTLLDTPNDWEKIAPQLAIEFGQLSLAQAAKKSFSHKAIIIFCTIFCLHYFSTADYYQIQPGYGLNLNPSRNVLHPVKDHSLLLIQAGIAPHAKKYFMDLQSDENGREIQPSLVKFLHAQHETIAIVATGNLQLAVIKSVALPIQITKPIVSLKSSPKRLPFYVGFEAGAAYNQVKGQGLGKPGITVGLLAGYSFSKRLSVETGISLNKKNYYTNGKYFHMNKAGENMPNGMKVLYVDGSCAIFDIPINIKYTFPNRKNTRIYAIAGVSTYLMSKESNKYQAILNGAEQTVLGVYNRPRSIQGATIQLGFGMEKNISAKSSFRIAPYVQIPLKGIGVGDIPVMSVGIKIGLTRSVH